MSAFTDQIPYTFKNEALLRRALTTPSAKHKDPDNQRLEFLGDAVLQLLVSERLYRLYPCADEGTLSVMRRLLVSGEALFKKASTFCGGMMRLLDCANPQTPTTKKAQIDAIEALIGAAWEDGGRDAAEQLLAVLYSPRDFAGVAMSTDVTDNPKGELLQVAQLRYATEPIYAELEKIGPLHAPTFTCSVTLGGNVATGNGSSRKAAEKQAALAWLNLYTKDAF